MERIFRLWNEVIHSINAQHAIADDDCTDICTHGIGFISLFRAMGEYYSSNNMTDLELKALRLVRYKMYACKDPLLDRMLAIFYEVYPVLVVVENINISEYRDVQFIDIYNEYNDRIEWANVADEFNELDLDDNSQDAVLQNNDQSADLNDVNVMNVVQPGIGNQVQPIVPIDLNILVRTWHAHIDQIADISCQGGLILNQHIRPKPEDIVEVACEWDNSARMSVKTVCRCQTGGLAIEARLTGLYRFYEDITHYAQYRISKELEYLWNRNVSGLVFFFKDKILPIVMIRGKGLAIINTMHLFNAKAEDAPEHIPVICASAHGLTYGVFTIDEETEYDKRMSYFDSGSIASYVKYLTTRNSVNEIRWRISIGKFRYKINYSPNSYTPVTGLSPVIGGSIFSSPNVSSSAPLSGCFDTNFFHW